MTVDHLFNIVDADFLPVLQLTAHPFDDGLEALPLHPVHLNGAEIPHHIIGDKPEGWQQPAHS
ncbi:hypothetical protein D3C81_2123620 [compost metagenome]